jgi:hypothetical protein
MSRPLIDRGAPWRPGVLLLVAAVGLAVLAGMGLGARSWTAYLGLSLGFLLLFGWVERIRFQRPSPPPRRKTHLKVIQGGRQYDLAEDSSTDDQKYVM